MLRADSYPIGTRFEQNPNSATRLFGTLVGYSKQGPDMAIIEWDHGLNITVTPISELKHCPSPENESLDVLYLYKNKYPKDRLYEVVLTVPYYAYADSVEEALSYAEEALEEGIAFYIGHKATLLKSPKDAKYHKHFGEDDYVFNSQCYQIKLGDALRDLKLVNKSVKGKSVGKSKRDQLYHAAEEHGGKASVLLSSEPKKNTKSKKVTKSKKKKPVTSKKR